MYFPDKHNYLDKKAEAETLMGTAGGIGSHNLIAQYFYLDLCISLFPIPFVLQSYSRLCLKTHSFILLLVYLAWSYSTSH